jgi:hypothetical protein
MFSVTLNIPVTNLTIAMNSRRSRNEITTTCVCNLLSHTATQEIRPLGARNVYVILDYLCVRLPAAGTDTCWSDYGSSTISSLISAVRCR